jgi:DNA-binding MarR family transcriptional regulator
MGGAFPRWSRLDGSQHTNNHCYLPRIAKCYVLRVAATDTRVEVITPGPAKSEIMQSSGFLLAQLGRAVTRQYRCALSPIGLKPRETQALLRLRAHSAMNQQALGVALDIDASNLVTLLNDLEADGLISRRRDAEDRRRHVVELSRRGTKLLDEVERAAAGVEDEFFDALDEDERVVLRGLLARVAHSADVPSPAEMSGEEESC